MESFWKGSLPDPQVRTIDEMREVIAVPDCVVTFPLYFMFRDLALSDRDRDWLSSRDLRYDITVMPQAELCGEYIKTKGHYHPESGGGTGYPELYQVLSGEAHYLLQDEAARNVVVVRASAGESVLVPPGFGHVTINAGEGPLVMANIVSNRFSSDYRMYERMRGAAYYCCRGRGWVKNPAYGDVPELRHVIPQDFPNLGILHHTPIYSLIGREESLRFLNYPEEFREILDWL